MLGYFKKNGFTLVEVILTIGVLTIAFAAGLIFYGSFVKTVDLNTVAENIVGNLRRAQIRAMNANSLERWGVHFENPASGDDFYSLYSGDSYASDVEKNFLPAGVVFATPATSATIDVSFEKLSGANVAGSTQDIIIALTGDSSKTKTISINSAGMVAY